MSPIAESVTQGDPDIATIIGLEYERQENYLNLIASENYVSAAVLNTQGSILTNKYAEGYPGNRYYGGCVHVDEVERIAIERAKKLFNATYANVQPHSGSQANAAAYMALLQPGDTILGMSLDAGGHLTHGARVSFSGKLYRAVQYGINPETELVDYDQVADLAHTHRPKVIVAGFSAYSRVLDWKRFREIADAVDAYLVVDMAHIAGLVAADIYPSPVPHAHVVTTTTHKTLRGPRGGLILSCSGEEITKKLNSAVFPGGQGGPFMHTIAAKAVCFLEALQDDFRLYQQRVLDNARAMAHCLTDNGFHIISGDTDNHLFLVKLTGKDITGKEAQTRLEEAHIITNKNAVVNDPLSAMITSGLRCGTPAITTRGLGTTEAVQVAQWMCEILHNIHATDLIQSTRSQVLDLCRSFPVYRSHPS